MVKTVINPFQPLRLYNPPCSFALLNDGGAICEKGEERDHFGLCSPCEWDCAMPAKHPIDYYYENDMPSRRAACNCYCHFSNENTNDSACDTTYVVDEEMEQVITVLQAINIKTPNFLSMEVGSRQGQWLLKAVALAKRQNNPPYEHIYGHSIELKQAWKDRQREKLKRNGLEDVIRIDPQVITQGSYPQLIHNLTMVTGKWQPINHVDFDCQGCEQALDSEEAFELYDKNILQMFVAIHRYGNKISSQNIVTLSRRYQRDIVFSKPGSFKCEKENRHALKESRGFAGEVNSVATGTGSASSSSSNHPVHTAAITATTSSITSTPSPSRRSNFDRRTQSMQQQPIQKQKQEGMTAEEGASASASDRAGTSTQTTTAGSGIPSTSAQSARKRLEQHSNANAGTSTGTGTGSSYMNTKRNTNRNMTRNHRMEMQKVQKPRPEWTCLKMSAHFGPVYYRDGTLRLFNHRLYKQLGLTLRLPQCLPSSGL
eukprot:CAMPEP_0174969398 /NCGR_PEP_ID=MMETSP0004_2-20121128/8738_1 /TAXON_ID=420556 /ORGANISM="Ochromonas sp., Strain CCMP1393" /LENGTH=485 /DNA_ID=CAMNT_0016218879 /DNA_START=320 /DNA_END=1777 /DNA_ORIENTATION=+